MKKQILILFMAVFVLGTSHVFAQGPVVDPIPISDVCVVDDPLNVVAGRSYTYTVDVPAPPGDKTYHWFVTTNVNFITTNTLTTDRELLDGNSNYLASGSAHYNDPTLGTGADPDPFASIELTWKSFTLADDGGYLFVVIYVENDGDDGCPTDNLKVYRVETQHAFTLTVANIDYDTSTVSSTLEVCVDDVQTATFNPTHGDNGGVTYDYGQNAFYYGVAAANFSGDYALAAKFGTGDGTGALEGATGEGATGQDIEGIYWAYSMADLEIEANRTSVIAPAAGTEVDLGVVSPADGETFSEDNPHMIYIMVVVNHNQFEAADAAGYEYTLALDGLLPLANGTYGLHNDENDLGDQNQDATAAADDCRLPFGPHNQAVQTLLPRPRINADDPANAPLLPNAP